MASGMTPKVRLVRCPKCRQVLPELADVPVYKCGGCDTVLLAKNRRNVANSTSSGLHETVAAQSNALDQSSEGIESSSSSHKAISPSSGECSLDQNNDLDQNISGDCNSEKLGGVNLSNDDRNNGSDQNDSWDCNIEKPGVSNEVCSSSELARHVNEDEVCSPSELARHENDDEVCSSSELAQHENEDEVCLSSELVHHVNEEEACSSSELAQPENEDEVCSSSELAQHENEDEVCSSSVLAQHENEDEVCSSSELAQHESEDEVCSSSELAQHENEELSPLAGANAEVEVDGESSMVARGKSEVAVVNERESNFRSSSTDNLVATMGRNSIDSASRPAGESISVNTVISSPGKELKQPGFDRVRSTDTFETTDFFSPSSEFSCTFERMPKSPTTRSSHAYDGSISSYDGMDDPFPDRCMSSFVNAYKFANIVVSEDKPRRDKFPVNSLINSDSEMQHQSRNSSSILSDKKHYSMKGSKWDWDELQEPTRHGRPVRNWTRMERDGYTSRVPYHRGGFPAGYEHGSPSNQVHDEFDYSSSFYSPDKHEYTKDKTELLRMVYELQDQLNKKWHLNGQGNERVPAGGTWKEKHIPPYYGREVPEEEICHDLNHPRYPGRFRQASNWPQQSKFSRMPFSGEATNSRHQIDASFLHCQPQNWQRSTQLPQQILSHNKGFCRVHPGHNYHNSCSSCPSSPRRCTDSEFPIWGHETKSADLRHKDHEVKKYLREKHHFVKRHFRPIAGGAPFVTCRRCLKPLQLPADFLIFKRRCHRLRCGACLQVLEFKLQHRTHIVPYTPDAIDPAPSELEDYRDAINRRNMVSASHANDFPHADPVSCSDDYGVSFCKSYSTDGDPFSSALPPFDAFQGNAYDRDMSCSSVDPMGEGKEFDLRQSRNKCNNRMQTSESIVPFSSMSKSEKISSEIEELPPTTGSPLHRLMGYSSPSEVINGSGSPRSVTSAYYQQKTQGQGIE